MTKNMTEGIMRCMSKTFPTDIENSVFYPILRLYYTKKKNILVLIHFLQLCHIRRYKIYIGIECVAKYIFYYYNSMVYFFLLLRKRDLPCIIYLKFEFCTTWIVWGKKTYDQYFLFIIIFKKEWYKLQYDKLLKTSFGLYFEPASALIKRKRYHK